MLPINSVHHCFFIFLLKWVNLLLTFSCSNAPQNVGPFLWPDAMSCLLLYYIADLMQFPILKGTAHVKGVAGKPCSYIFALPASLDWPIKVNSHNFYESWKGGHIGHYMLMAEMTDIVQRVTDLLLLGDKLLSL